MRFQRFLGWLIMLLVFGMGAFYRPQVVQADKRSSPVDEIHPGPSDQASAYDLILAMNTLRVSHGLPALIEDPIINAVAQSTAATMAANNMSWHIGDVRGRLAAAGYGNGGTVWATENFAVSSKGMGIDEIMAAWPDADHMRPAVEAAYCNVGAGVAQTSDGRIYYILQAAYVSEHACGSSLSTGGNSQPGSGAGGVSQLIVPVKIATPDADGKIIHEVQPYQALYTIAEAYHVSVDRILVLNGLQADWPLQIGQKLVISPGNITPSPTLSNIQKLTPEADGKYYHIVRSGETLSWIAALYDVPLADLMTWNGLNNTSVIRPAQKLLLLVTPPATPTLTPSPTTIPPSPSPSITPLPPTGTPPVTGTESSRRFGLRLILGVIILLIGGSLWWRFARKS